MFATPSLLVLILETIQSTSGVLRMLLQNGQPFLSYKLLNLFKAATSASSASYERPLSANGKQQQCKKLQFPLRASTVTNIHELYKLERESYMAQQM